MVLRRLAAGLCLAAVASIVVLAQAEEFKGEVKVDKGKFRNAKKVALVDVLGQAKRQSEEHLAAWTADALKLAVEGLNKMGREVVMGPAVNAAFDEIVPLPTYEQLKAAAIKRGVKEQQADGMARMLEKNWQNYEPGEAQKIGFAYYRPDGSVNLERPTIDVEKAKVKEVDEKELRRRIGLLREKLGVDTIVALEFGYGDARWEEPGWQKAAKARGAAIGLVPAIGNLKGMLKGSTADVHVRLNAYDADGKKEIVEVLGMCASKKGTGMFSKNLREELEKLMPETITGCVPQAFEKIAKKEK